MKWVLTVIEGINKEAQDGVVAEGKENQTRMPNSNYYTAQESFALNSRLIPVPVADVKTKQAYAI